MKKTLFAILMTTAALSALTALGQYIEPVRLVINSAETWASFARYVNEGGTTLNAEMTADVTLTPDSPRIGDAEAHAYAGTFYGEGHKLTVNWNTNGVECLAPFAWVGGATIRDLHTAGTITSNSKFASGMVGKVCSSGATIERCRSSVVIVNNVSGDATSAGFIACIAHGEHSVSVNDCLFDGSLICPNGNQIGGFVGWIYYGESTIQLNRCLFAPQKVSVTTDESCATFVRANGDDYNFSTSYYTSSLGRTQSGNNASPMTAEALVAALGDKWTVKHGKAMLATFGNEPMTLYDGETYTVANTETIQGENGECAIAVADGASAIINIKSGVTLTVNGADASGAIGAAPAIRVPASSTLYIVGGGTLIATGGAAANGGNGRIGGSALIDYGDGAPSKAR